MKFDVKKYFPRKEGFGDTVLSIPEMQAEIARLQAEVDRTNDVLESQAHVIRDLRDQLGMCDHSLVAAWNDAIEAAAELCKSKSHTELDVRERDYYKALGYELAAEDILSLKRQPEQTE